MINKDYIYAIVGASNNKEKYGYKVMKDLLLAGFKVVPINPHEQEILGEKVYASLGDYSKKIDVVIFVVPPTVTEMVLTEVLALGINQVWLQPGSENEKAIQFCLDHKIKCIYGACIMVNRNK